FAIKNAGRVRWFKFLNRPVFERNLEIRKKDPPLKASGQAAVMIDCHTHNNARQPDPQWTVASKAFDAAISAHQRLLDDVLRVCRIPRRSHCNLKQKR